MCSSYVKYQVSGEKVAKCDINHFIHKIAAFLDESKIVAGILIHFSAAFNIVVDYMLRK